MHKCGTHSLQSPQLYSREIASYWQQFVRVWQHLVSMICTAETRWNVSVLGFCLGTFARPGWCVYSSPAGPEGGFWGCCWLQVGTGGCWGMPREALCAAHWQGCLWQAFMTSISQELMFKLPGCPCIHVLLDCTVVSFIKNKCEGTCAASGQGLKPW